MHSEAEGVRAGVESDDTTMNVIVTDHAFRVYTAGVALARARNR